ncbi:MAG: hypothetical protein U5L96_16900 [Owenweeksia sp.]|nr:hypothetical protein [Owenweeksia sp.]
MWRVFLTILIIVFLADLALSQLDGHISNYFESHIPAIISGVGILTLAGIRVNFFSYEDEYEIIHIRSKSLIFGSFETKAQTRYEFPKRIIYNFEYKKNWFQRKLIIYLITQHGVKKVRKFDLSFVPIRKLQYVKQSLQHICEENKQHVQA